MQDDIETSCNHFNCGSESQWRQLVEKSLQGAAFETLIKHDEDGLPLGPLFYADKNIDITGLKTAAPHLAGRPWHVCAPINYPRIAKANQDILAALKGGASALSLTIDPAGKTGIAVRNKADLDRLFDGVIERLIPIYLAQSRFFDAAIFAARFKAHKEIEHINLYLGYSPSLSDIGKLRSMITWVADTAPHWRVLCIHGADLHEKGASPAQELAYMAAQMVANIQNLEGIATPQQVFSLTEVRLAVDQNAHLSIVKLRAARLLWQNLALAYGVDDGPMHLQALSSRRMLAKQDVWANILRLNSACFGASCGGADSINLSPFTEALGFTTPFAQRLSRNIQLLQMHESHLGRVQDPAHGSFMHEQLTQKLAEHAWTLFQGIEKRGGWAKAKDGFMAAVKERDKTRQNLIDSGELLRIGVNQYVKPDVRKPDILPAPSLNPRFGVSMDAQDFASALAQADEGFLSPIPATGGPHEN